VHVDAAANHRMCLRMPPGSDYLLRRVTDVLDMHIGSYESMHITRIGKRPPAPRAHTHAP
jgi:hypothetical protein